MNVFNLRDQLVGQYSHYVKSFIQIRDERISEHVTQRLEEGMLWPEPLIVPGRGSLVSELIALAGGSSVTADQGLGYPRMSLEAAVGRAPEVIILARHGGPAGPAVLPQWQRLESLPAIKGGRLYAVDGNLLHRYGPRVAEGLEAIARLLHPEAFP